MIRISGSRRNEGGLRPHGTVTVLLGAAAILLLIVASVISQKAYAASGHAFQRSPVTMKWAESGEPVSIDPAIANVDFDFNVTRNTYEGLTTYSTKTLHVLPALATSWSVAGRTWTFRLRHNVRFVDGSTFTGQDVAATLKRTLSINQGEAYLISDVKKIVVVNPYLVRITTAAPDVYLAANLSHIGIVSRAAIIKHGNFHNWAKTWFASHTDGTAPYTLQSWAHGSQLVLVRNPNYWRGWKTGQVDRFIDVFVSNVSTRVQGVQGGQYTMGNYLPVADGLRVGRSPGFKIVTGFENFSFPAIYLNVGAAPTNNIKLREAFAKAFDYHAMISYDHGLAVTPRGPIPSFLPLSPESQLPPRTQDLNAAKTLANSSGKKGSTITCGVPTGLAEFSVAATLFQAAGQQLGITVKLNNEPFAQFIDDVHNNHVQCAILGEANLSPDPTGFFASHYLTGAFYNLAHYSNPTFDALVTQIRKTFKPGPRYGLLYRASKMLADDYNTIWTVRPKLVWDVPKYVTGFSVDPTDYHIVRLYDLRFLAH
jgi:peptide/nickel transport system substrate-binding protein